MTGIADLKEKLRQASLWGIYLPLAGERLSSAISPGSLAEKFLAAVPETTDSLELEELAATVAGGALGSSLSDSL